MAAGVGFWAGRRSAAVLEPGVLTTQVNTIADGWETGNVPTTGRVVNIIVSGTQAASPAAKPSTRYDGETLPLTDKPSTWQKAINWFKRTFLRTTMSAGTTAQPLKSLEDMANTAAWTYSGETASDDEVTREVMKAVTKANNSGAAVNIITQGPAAAPVLKAIKCLEGTAQVAKLVALDTNIPTLRTINPAYFAGFKRPANLTEWVNIWRDVLPPHAMTIELFSRKYNGARFAADELLPEAGLPPLNTPAAWASAAELAVYGFVRILARPVVVIEEFLDSLAQAARARAGSGYGKIERFQGREYLVEEAKNKAEEKTIDVTTKGLINKARQIQVPDVPKPSPLNAARPKIEVKKAAAPAPKPAADSGPGNASNCATGICSWYDAMAYCSGRLPTVAELTALYKAKCADGKGGDACNQTYWSSEAVENAPSFARYVSFKTGKMNYLSRIANGTVLCK